MRPLPSLECLICILLSSKKEASLKHYLGLHILRGTGQETHPLLGSLFISVCAQSGNFEASGKLTHPRGHSLDATIASLVEGGHPSSGFMVYKKMQEEHGCIYCSSNVFVTLLKVCGQLKDLERGYELHVEVARKGLLESCVYIGSSLVWMYSKCGCLVRAQSVFDEELTIRNIVSWNALIAGCVENGCGEVALCYFKKMQEENIPPNIVTLVCTLKASTITRDITYGRDIHDAIHKKGFEKENVIGNALVDMYAKCGFMDEAEEVFGKLHMHTVAAWTALLTGYAEYGYRKESLDCLKCMEDELVSLDATAYVCILKACSSTGTINKGFEVHTELICKALDGNCFIGSSLVDMYAKCGLIGEACEVFEKLNDRDLISWTSLIAGFVENGQCKDALNYTEKMQHEHLSVGMVAANCCLKSCAIIGDIKRGREIHDMVIQKGHLEREFSIGSSLIDMYFKCGFPSEAQIVFDKLPIQCTASWTTLITGLIEGGLNNEALKQFQKMQGMGVSPTAVTYVCCLKACTSAASLVKARELHASIVKKGYLEDVYIRSALVDVYAKCKYILDAQSVFDESLSQNVVSWTALIGGYTDCDRSEDALDCFEQMQHNGVCPVSLTLVCTLRSCSNIRCISKGHETHTEIFHKGFEIESMVSNALINMYSKCGNLVDAFAVFRKLPIQTPIAWATLISGYIEHGYVDEAVKCLEEMICKDIFMDANILILSLNFWGDLGAMSKGQQIHAQCATKGMENAPLLGNSLVDMYGKCGSMSESQEVFDKLPVRDVVSWTAIIAGYAHSGKSQCVFILLDRMIGEGVKPDSITFISIINACSHEGLVDKGQMYFEFFCNYYGPIPSIEHCICMIDLLGRAGDVEKAVKLTQEMPYDQGTLVWQIVLGACRKSGNVQLGLLAFQHALHLDERNGAAHICMFNIYADATFMQDESCKHAWG